MNLQIDFIKLIAALTISNLIAIKIANCYDSNNNNKFKKLCMQTIAIFIASTGVLFFFGETIQGGAGECEFAKMPINTGEVPF